MCVIFFLYKLNYLSISFLPIYQVNFEVFFLWKYVFFFSLIIFLLFDMVLQAFQMDNCLVHQYVVKEADIRFWRKVFFFTEITAFAVYRLRKCCFFFLQNFNVFLEYNRKIYFLRIHMHSRILFLYLSIVYFLYDSW